MKDARVIAALLYCVLLTVSASGERAKKVIVWDVGASAGRGGAVRAKVTTRPTIRKSLQLHRRGYPAGVMLRAANGGIYDIRGRIAGRDRVAR